MPKTKAFGSLKIQHKILASFAIILAPFMGLSIYSYLASGQTRSLAQRLQEEAYLTYKEGAKLQEEFAKMSVLFNEAIGFVEESRLAKAKESVTRFSEGVTRLKGLAKDDTREIGKIADIFAGYHTLGERIVTTLLAKNDLAAVEKEVDSFGSTGTQLGKLLNDYTVSKDEAFKKGVADLGQLTRRSETLVLGISLVSLLLSFALAYTVSRAIARPLKQITVVAEKLAVGDLTATVNIERTDEIGDLARSFRDSINYIAGLSTAIDALSKNDLTIKLEPKSEHDVLTRNIVRTIDTLRELERETSALTRAAQAGKLDARGNAGRFQGVYAELIQAINGMLDAMAEPLNEAADVLHKIAARDLTARMKGNYKGEYARIKDALNSAAVNLEQALAQVMAGMEQVASASNQINAGSQTLAQGASQQASSIQEAASNLNDMSLMTKQNAASAQEARSLAADANQSANDGAQGMQKLSEAIARIKSSADATAKIVKTIDEIAFQTNLLALNAAVEAARAGDAGKGFAVVAEEVRNLAMRSADAAKNTADLIEESVKNAESGVDINVEALKSLAQINDKIKKVREVMEEIAVASDKQAHGVDQIQSAMERMNALTQQTAANSEESAATAQELSSQATETLRMVSSFTIEEAHHSGASFSHAVPARTTAAPAAKKQMAKPYAALSSALASDLGKGGKALDNAGDFLSEF